MAVTEQERRAMNRRKMAIQAGINAKRNSLMTLQSTPVRSAGNFIADPRTLPGRNIVDANNAAALNLANQNPGVNLTNELNRRAASQTVVDLERADTRAAIQDMNRNTAMEAATPIAATSAAPMTPSPAPAVQPTPFNYGPGLTPARAEELYGPGGMYGTTPLPGGLYDQMGTSSGMMPSSTVTAPRSASDNLTDAVKKIKKRAAIIRGTAALVGGDASAADRYEAEALASLGVYAGQYAMSQLTDADFKDKQTLFQSLLAKGMPLDQILQVLESGVAPDGSAAPKPPKREKRKETDPSTGVTYEITEQWNTNTGEFEEVSRAETKTGPMVQIMPGEGALDKGNAEKFSQNFSQLIDDPERTYAGLRADNERIDQLQAALDQGLQTGATAETFLTLGRMVQSVLPQTEATQKVFADLADRLGTAEWFKATSERFIGGMLAMTKGAVSDREMKIFMGMIPSLSTTKNGNQRLLRMMKELNELALSEHYAAQDLNDYLIDQNISMSQLGTAKARKMLAEFKEQREADARKRFERESKPETFEEAVSQIKAINPGMSDTKAKELAQKHWGRSDE